MRSTDEMLHLIMLTMTKRQACKEDTQRRRLGAVQVSSCGTREPVSGNRSTCSEGEFSEDLSKREWNRRIAFPGQVWGECAGQKMGAMSTVTWRRRRSSNLSVKHSQVIREVWESDTCFSILHQVCAWSRCYRALLVLHCQSRETKMFTYKDKSVLIRIVG